MYFVLRSAANEVRVFAKVRDNFSHEVPAMLFLEKLAGQKQYSATVRGLSALFSRYAEKGKAGLTHEMFHEVDSKNGIWEFIRNDLRIFCFRDGSHVVLTHGAIKKTQKVDPLEVTTASAAKKKYFEENNGKRP